MSKSRICSTCKSTIENERKNQGLCRLCHNAYMRINRKKYSELSIEEKIKADARSIVHLYVKRGNIKKLPCCICGESNSEAHHEDYSKPLNVNWLCRKCHLQYHFDKLKKPLKVEKPLKILKTEIKHKKLWHKNNATGALKMKS